MQAKQKIRHSDYRRHRRHNGCLCAWKSQKVLLIEKACPYKTELSIGFQRTQNVSCLPCSIMQGMEARRFSDGVCHIYRIWGWLTSFMQDELVLSYINKADQILIKHGASQERYLPDDELKLICLQHDLHMQQAELKHLGTDENFSTMLNLIDNLGSKCEILTNTPVVDIDKDKNIVHYTHDGQTFSVKGDNIIIAVGRAGSSFLVDWCKKNGIKMSNNQWISE